MLFSLRRPLDGASGAARRSFNGVLRDERLRLGELLAMAHLLMQLQASLRMRRAAKAVVVNERGDACNSHPRRVRRCDY
jgi:hypothetical protein